MLANHYMTPSSCAYAGRQVGEKGHPEQLPCAAGGRATQESGRSLGT
jgi:hypothetical protein